MTTREEITRRTLDRLKRATERLERTGTLAIPAHLINESSPSNYAAAKVAESMWSRKPPE